MSSALAFLDAPCARFQRSDETLRIENRRSRNLSQVDWDRLGSDSLSEYREYSPGARALSPIGRSRRDVSPIGDRYFDCRRIRADANPRDMRRKRDHREVRSVKDIFGDDEPRRGRISRKVGYNRRGRFVAHKRSSTESDAFDLSDIAGQLSGELFSDGYDSDSGLIGESSRCAWRGRDFEPLKGSRRGERKAVREVFDEGSEDVNDRFDVRKLERVNFGRRENGYRSSSRREPLDSIFSS